MNDGMLVPRRPERFLALDGLRGMAALVVVCFHFGSGFLPRLIPDQTDHPYWLAFTPVGILYNGPFAVSIFFVLSGFVLYQAASASQTPLYVQLILRYLRLALPATASVLFAWALLKWIPNAASQVNALSPHAWTEPRSVYQGQIPGLTQALYDGSVGIFRGGSSLFNNVLWTMQVEAVGSIAIYLFCSMPNYGRWRMIFGVALGMAAIAFPMYLGFALGAALSELLIRGRLKRIFPVGALIVGILLGFPGKGFAAMIGLPQVRRRFTIGATGGYFPAIAAALILYALLLSPSLNRAFSQRVLRFFGAISFPLYLLHVPLLYTLIASAYLWMLPGSRFSLVCLLLGFLVLSLACAVAGEVWVDRPTLRLLKRLKQWLSHTGSRSGSKMRDIPDNS
jgi:peptidoglycan/LPS O-acetylase OafA/YrhL